METELERAKRTGQPVTVIVGDLDHFKSVNDRFGHRVGDQTLQRFATASPATSSGGSTTWRGSAARSSRSCCPTATSTAASSWPSGCAARCATTAWDAPASPSASASRPARATRSTSEQLLHCADQALYLAKQLGRDRSVIFSEEVAESLAAGGTADTRQAVEQVAAVLILAETLDLRDSGTAQHSQTVGRLCEQIAARRSASPPARVERVRLAGLLHDLGKIGVADTILQKPGALARPSGTRCASTPSSARGSSAARTSTTSAPGCSRTTSGPTARGYPSGLAGDEIPLEARILAVADSFEAMTSDRVYRKGMPVEDALAELRRCAGTQFDGDVVEAFIGAVGVGARCCSLAPDAHRALPRVLAVVLGGGAGVAGRARRRARARLGVDQRGVGAGRGLGARAARRRGRSGSGSARRSCRSRRASRRRRRWRRRRWTC